MKPELDQQPQVVFVWNNYNVMIMLFYEIVKNPTQIFKGWLEKLW